MAIKTFRRALTATACAVALSFGFGSGARASLVNFTWNPSATPELGRWTIYGQYVRSG